MLENLVKEWRDARENIFTKLNEIQKTETADWIRLGNAECALMTFARENIPK